jgi:DNA-binding MarR family transcriptional regulator
MTEWLTDDEQQTWRGLVYLTAQLSAKFNRQLQEEHGISLADYEVLARLHDAPEEGLRSRDLQATLVWEQSRLSHQLTRMQGRGLVRRHDCATDRRGATFTLTDTGRAAIEEAAPGHVTAVRRLLFDHLTPDDVTTLATLATRITNNLYNTNRSCSD